MVLNRVNRTAWGYQTAPHGSLGLPCGLYQFMSLAESTALLFESEWVLYPAFSSPPNHPHHPPNPPPTHPPLIDSIRDITGTEKTLKNQQHSNS